MATITNSFFNYWTHRKKYFISHKVGIQRGWKLQDQKGRTTDRRGAAAATDRDKLDEVASAIVTVYHLDSSTGLCFMRNIQHL